eukprot:s2517_g5.t2
MAAAAPPRALLRVLGLACLVSGKDPPCPEDATVMSCSDWCRTVYPGSRATMSGSSCARLSAQDLKRGMGPACICYDSGYEKELKSCRSKCPVEEDPAEANTLPLDGDVSSGVGGSCFGSTGRDTCRADQLTDESERYLLYDVKPGEGFNLQREVFPRVGWIVAQLNAASQQWCSGANLNRCPRWSLVLPPWCRLAHWRRASEEHVPWERFFDAKALRSTNITVLEFYEFVAKAGGPNVDLVISSTTERQPRNQMMSKPRKSGGFYGFTRTPQQCFSGGRGSLKLPRQEWMPEDFFLQYRCLHHPLGSSVFFSGRAPCGLVGARCATAAMDAFSPCRIQTPQSAVHSACNEKDANSPMKVIPGLPEIEYPSPVSVRNTFLDTDIGRPPSLDEFFQERLLRSAPGSALPQSKMFDSQVDEEPEFLPSTTPVIPTAWPRTMSGEGLEDFFAAVGVAGVTDISTGQSPSAKEMPPPPPMQNAPQFVAAELPPLPAGGYASDLPVPVKLAQVLKEPEVGTPEVPTMGSRNHRLGNCRPCAFFHTKGCSSGMDCEFCHLCDAGEKKRRAKQRAVLRKGLELQDAPQPLAVGLVTASSAPPALPGMLSYAPMPLPGMWPPPL